MTRFIDITGKKSGRLTAIMMLERNKKTFWLFHCDCGNKVRVAMGDFMNGRTKSCGCFKRDTTINLSTKHGLKDHRLYSIWCNMKSRCYNRSNHGYKNYGGRGIIICKSWRNRFINFYNWAILNGYDDHLTIERDDNNGNYKPSNCRWATRMEQCRNQRSNVLITHEGKTLCLIDWAKLKGLRTTTLRRRINKDWPVAEALETPTLRTRKVRK